MGGVDAQGAGERKSCGPVAWRGRKFRLFRLAYGSLRPNPWKAVIKRLELVKAEEAPVDSSLDEQWKETRIVNPVSGTSFIDNKKVFWSNHSIPKLAFF